MQGAAVSMAQNQCQSLKCLVVRSCAAARFVRAVGAEDSIENLLNISVIATIHTAATASCRALVLNMRLEPSDILVIYHTTHFANALRIFVSAMLAQPNAKMWDQKYVPSPLGRSVSIGLRDMLILVIHQ